MQQYYNKQIAECMNASFIFKTQFIWKNELQPITNVCAWAHVCIDLLSAITLNAQSGRTCPLCDIEAPETSLCPAEQVRRREPAKKTEETNEGVSNRKQERKEERNNKGQMKDGQEN